MFIYLLLLALLTLALYAYLTVRNAHLYWRLRGVPHVPGIPILGNLAPICLQRTSVVEHYDALYRNPATAESPLLGMHIFVRPALMIRSPELIKQVLIKDFAAFNNRYSTSDVHSDLLGSGSLFFVKNPSWRTIRARLTPFFTSGKMRQMFGLMSAVGSDLAELLRRERGTLVEVRDIFARYSTDIVASCAFGVQAGSLRDPGSEFRREGRKIFDFTLWRAAEFTSMFFLPAAVPIFGFKLFSHESSAFLRNSIEWVMAERQRSGEVRNDLIDTLLVLREEDRDKEMSPTNIVFQGDVLVAQAAAFFTAGYETTSTVLSFALFELCRRPEVQNRMREEIRQVLQRQTGPPTYDDIHGMEYMGMVISEVLRLYPPLPFLDRECTVEPDTAFGLDEFSSFSIPRGMPLVIPIYSLHRDAKYFPRPEYFDPERFSSANRDSILPYTYLPFGAGPHNCIGNRFGLLQIRLGLWNFFRDHRVEPAAGGRTPERLAFDRRALLTTAEGGVFVGVVSDPVVER